MYADADWGSDISDRKSFSGYATVFAGSAVTWGYKMQSNIALSTVKAEFVAITEALRECIWIRNFLSEIGQSECCAQSTTIHSGNQGAVKLVENRNTSERTKHIDLRKFFVLDAIDSGVAELAYVATGQNIADGLTKQIESVKMDGHPFEIIGYGCPGGGC